MRHYVEVDWPGGEWLEKKECLVVLGVPETLFDRLVESGLLPLTGNARVKLWHWKDLLHVSGLLTRLIPFTEKKVSSPDRSES